MDKIKRFVECTIPVSQCNLRCSYCYVIQENRRNAETSKFRCSPEEIGKAFTVERWGGLMLVNLCAFGETLLCPQLPEISFNILRNGHYINITNNGTMTKQLERVLLATDGMHDRICFAFSLHYVELKNRNLLEVFVSNVNMIKSAGCSYLIQLNLCDEYIECLDEIKLFCQKSFGALPQVALTRKEGSEYNIFSEYSDKEYFEFGRSFDSPLFSFTSENFKVKRKEFCYAGDWSFKLDIASGDLRCCYFDKPFYNIYDNITEPIKTKTVGNNCGCTYCVNSSHFISLGVIPEIRCTTYVSLRDRGNKWYTESMRQFLSGKLYENNTQYSILRKMLINFKWNRESVKKYTLKRLHKIRRKINVGSR